MQSFAWGLSPSSARSQVPLAPFGGCTVTDVVWSKRITDENTHNLKHTTDPVLKCDVWAAPSTVPKLLLQDMLVCLARRLLKDNDSILNAPIGKVIKALTSSESPPNFWLVTVTTCFPCDGTPITRCLEVIALLDSAHVQQARVLFIVDKGVVPAEQASSSGVLPLDATRDELLVPV